MADDILASRRPERRPETVTLAHISDLHLGPLPRIPLGLIDAKRISGAINWFRKRRHIHRAALVDALLSDLAQVGIDHLAVGGDLANIGLPAEIERGAQLLARAGPPDRVSVVPGNHDIYSTLHGHRLGSAGLAAWAPYFASDEEGRRLGGRDDFPFVRMLSNGAVRVALIGLNSAVETPPFIATGRVGSDQLQALGGILDAAGRAGFARVVMLHHPPLVGQATPRHALLDADGLMRVLMTGGAELVIHGHNHRRMIVNLVGARGDIPVVGVPSASAARHRNGEDFARAHVFTFSPGTPGRPVITLVARGLVVPNGPIVEVERLTL